jgi:hypothetical protein
LVIAGIASGSGGCAALVGADFGDEYLGGDGGPAVVFDSGPLKPTPDAQTPSGDGASPHDSGPVVSANDGGDCPSGLTNCTGLCVDPTTNPEHCGRCTTACPNDPHGSGVCVSSHCTYACDNGWIECAGGCCNPVTDSGPSLDAAPSDDGGSVGVTCGAQACPVAENSFCCGQEEGNPPDTCDTNVGDNCPVEMFCDDAADCAAQGGGVCCYDQNQLYSFCQSNCDSNQLAQLCNPAASGECQEETQCTGQFEPANTVYSYCQ